MEPLLVLCLLPVLIGVASERLFRDTAMASLAAAVSSPLTVFLWVSLRDPDGTWDWLATLLVAPLAIAFSLATVFICCGRSRLPKRERHNGA